MSEVIQCDVCEAISEPNRPRQLSQRPWIAVDDGGPGGWLHVCSPGCLAALAVRMGAQ